MSSSFGSSIRFQLFGQSHSRAIGAVIDGLPAGEFVDMTELASFMSRRAPGQTAYSTSRKEADTVQIVSGINRSGQTCGAPLALLIENSDTRSSDYIEIAQKPRPGHADITAWSKWLGEQDVFGGGHFSGRLTAPLMAAGGICKQILNRRGIVIGAHIYSLAGIEDTRIDTVTPDAGTVMAASQKDFPVLDDIAGNLMKQTIISAHESGDSVGGIVECLALNMPWGVGSPMFGSLESSLAQVLFGIPAVKGVEFGSGFEASRMRGSVHNDPLYLRDNRVAFASNNAGGILGGITNGMPVVVRVAFKPTPTIGLPQQTIDLTTQSETVLSAKGRHDPTVVVRAVPVVEAAVAAVLADALKEAGFLQQQLQPESHDQSIIDAGKIFELFKK
ncbi:MAG: chorismate synthase [Coriobacteriales bacterium]|nr:chorismate synthase [Coriobacteriales bacterium]